MMTRMMYMPGQHLHANLAVVSTEVDGSESALFTQLSCFKLPPGAVVV